MAMEIEKGSYDMITSHGWPKIDMIESYNKLIQPI